MLLPGVSACRLQPVEAQLLNDVDILEEAGTAEDCVHNHSPDGTSNCGHLQVPSDTACQAHTRAQADLPSAVSVWSLWSPARPLAQQQPLCCAAAEESVQLHSRELATRQRAGSRRSAAIPSCCWMLTSRKNPVPRYCISTTVVQTAPAAVATLGQKGEKSLTSGVVQRTAPV